MGSGAGSPHVTNCTCNDGYVGFDGVNCTLCPRGTFKLGTNPGVCTPCPEGTYQDNEVS